MKFSTCISFLVILFHHVAFAASESSEACDDDTAKIKIKVKDLWKKDNKNQALLYLGGIYEHSTWVAETLLEQPASTLQSITTVSALANAMKAIVDQAPTEQKMTLLLAHPDLAQKVEALRELTPESQEEQSKAGLQTMTTQEHDQFTKLNTRYRDKFQFPFILAVRHATKFTVLSALEGRLVHSKEREIVIALEQVHKIAWMRLLTMVESDEPAGFLTCHVLDTANGCPAANMRISLTRLSPPESAGLIGNFVTNDDGRLEGGPALKGANFTAGTYEWIFYAGDYFASQGTFVAGTPFLDEVPLRFGIDNPDDHYHVPLLVSPWSFSTYRGS